MNQILRLAIFILFLFQSLPHLRAQSGSLDSTFNLDGIAGVYIGNGDSKSQAVAIQNDGKIVVAGFFKNGSYYDFAVVRYKANGTPDSTFGGDGIVTTDFYGYDDQAFGVAIQSDGKIVVAGYCYHNVYGQKVFAVARYLSNGSLDNTFSLDGKAFANFGSGNQMGTSVAIQQDKKIVVCGNALFNPTQTYYQVGVARFDTVGILDNSFSSNGIATYIPSGGNYHSYGFDILIQNNQKIVVGGTISTATGNKAYVMRLYSDGSSDNTFGISGKNSIAINNISTSGNKMCLQADQKILMVGGSNNDMAVMRFTQHGAIDSTFDNDGSMLIDFGTTSAVGYAIAVAPDGKIIPAGVKNTSTNNYDFALARLNTDGSFDLSFGDNGKSTVLLNNSDDWLCDVAVQTEGKIIATGYYGSTNAYFRTVRLLTCNNITVNRTASDCLQYYWDETKQTLTASGVYYAKYQSAAGCDSTIKLTLTIYQNPNVAVTRSGNTLTAVQGGATYQWLDCYKNNDPIPGATSQSFTATVNGSYRVEITKDGCRDFSNCQTFTSIGIEEKYEIPFSIYPNPSSDYVLVNSINPEAQLIVTDIQGKQLFKSEKSQSSLMKVDLSPYASGIYYFTIMIEGEGCYTRKVIKN